VGHQSCSSWPEDSTERQDITSGDGFNGSAKYVICATHLTQFKAEINSFYSHLPQRCAAIRQYGRKYAKNKTRIYVRNTRSEGLIHKSPFQEQG